MSSTNTPVQSVPTDQQCKSIYKKFKKEAKTDPLKAVRDYKHRIFSLYNAPDTPPNFYVNRLRKLERANSFSDLFSSVGAGLISGLIASALFTWVQDTPLEILPDILAFFIVLVPTCFLFSFLALYLSKASTYFNYRKKSSFCYYRLFLCDWEIELLRTRLEEYV